MILNSGNALSLFLFQRLMKALTHYSHNSMTQKMMKVDHSPCEIKIMRKQAAPTTRLDPASG